MELRVPSRVTVFAWRLVRDRLPKNSNRTTKEMLRGNLTSSKVRNSNKHASKQTKEKWIK